ncbi:hypothetical protein QZH41_016128 [Actinostola sp. cb2023]|nr:hypothetical protein QZH41_016128 [Actinostola sp. cb2023]
MIFGVVRKLMDVRKIEDAGNQAYGVDLNAVIVWAIREQRLHQLDKEDIEFNIKLDGRCLGGRDQVLIGLVPIENAYRKAQSSKAVYPLVMANCKETRYMKEIERLIRTLNTQKNAIKRNGITVDGKEYKIKFSVTTADYKALCLLMKKKMEDNDNFKIGGRGLDTDCCIYCLAIRGCACKITADEDGACIGCLKDCYSRSKANIGSWTGLRDDLLFLLDEELSNVFIKWREIALIVRNQVFEEEEEDQIDLYDMKAKEWGYLLREVFGDRLGTGDYGHLTIEHSAMLFRRFRSFTKYSNQGFEALHRIQRQVYTRATNHDSTSPGQSCKSNIRKYLHVQDNPSNLNYPRRLIMNILQ